MDKLPTNKRLQTLDATLENSNHSNSVYTARNKPFDEPMTPEFRKKYLSNIIKFIDDRINEAQQNLAASEKYLQEAQSALGRLDKMFSMVNNLRRKPSAKSLKQIDFLRNYIPKLIDKQTRKYEQRKFELTVALDVNHGEINKYREELNTLNNNPNKNE